MNAQQQGTYMTLLMAGRENEALSYRDKCNASAHSPNEMGTMNKYFYTFGSSPQFPYQNGWVEVHATDWEEAHEKFRGRFPDRHPNCLNCAFFYDEEKWNQMDPEHTWHGYRCYEVIE